MKIVGIMPARNEDWIIGLSLRVALKWCDEVIVLDHASTDKTSPIVVDVMDESSGRVHVISRADEGWPEMAHREELLRIARERKSTHVALIDADEVLTANAVPVIRDQIEAYLRPNSGMALAAHMPCMWRSLFKYRTDGKLWAGRHDLTLAVALTGQMTYQTDGYDHHARAPRGTSSVGARLHPQYGVMHLQWASWRRLIAKHARYKMLERVKYPNKPVAEIDALYTLATDEKGLHLAQSPDEWWRGHIDLIQYVNLDAEPWQEAECKRLWAKHGAGYFAGLNLFGVVE